MTPSPPTPWTQLREMREALGLKQAELAEAVGGLGQAQISGWERGWNRPSVRNLQRLRTVLPGLDMPPVPATPTDDAEEIPA